MPTARLVVGVIAAAILTGCQHGSSTSADSLRCRGVDWRGYDKPLVSTEETARAIAEAVINENAANEPGGPYQLELEDGGDHWVAYQFSPPRTRDDGRIVVQFGGGVELIIDKCDGRVRSLRGQK